MIPTTEVLIGDVREQLRALRRRRVTVQCVVTSPPYWALRDYETEPQVWGGRVRCEHVWGDVGKLHRGGPQGAKGGRANRDTSAQDACGDVPTGQWCERCGAWRGQLGHEPTPELYVKHMVHIFRLVRTVLADDGVVWLNLGDCHTSDSGGYNLGGSRGKSSNARISKKSQAAAMKGNRNKVGSGLRPKNLVMMPHRVALALQADGWFVRMDNVWHKNNPLPESCRDRPTKAHEYMFLISKSERYFYDAAAIREPVNGTAHPRGPGNRRACKGVELNEGREGPFRTRDGIQAYADRMREACDAYRHDGQEEMPLELETAEPRAAGVNPKAVKFPNAWDKSVGEGAHGHVHKKGRLRGTHTPRQNESFSGAIADMVTTRNKRSVWTVPTAPYKDAHYATYPPDLIRPCVLAGSREGDVVLDPFGGTGTTAQVANEYGRHAILIDLDPRNSELIFRRLESAKGQGVLNFEAVQPSEVEVVA